jgi:hypothetical protein
MLKLEQTCHVCIIALRCLAPAASRCRPWNAHRSTPRAFPLSVGRCRRALLPAARYPNRPDDVGGIECGGHWTRTPWPPAVAAPSTIPSRPPPRSRSSAVPARRPRPRSSESRRFTPPVLPHPHRRRTTASSSGTCLQELEEQGQRRSPCTIGLLNDRDMADGRRRRERAKREKEDPSPGVGSIAS